jgi:2-iminobutanoate/2-iminopropanoate deaminase
VQTGLASNQYSVEMTFVASSAARDAIEDGRPPNPNLSTGIRSGGRLYLSGTLGNTAANKADAAGQTRETLAKLRSALTAAGASPADVVESLVYVTDLKLVADIDREYRAFFAGHAPARTTVRSGLMADDGLVEIVMTAVKS